MSERYTTYQLDHGPRIAVPGVPALTVLGEFSVHFHDYAHSSDNPSPYDARLAVSWDQDAARYVVRELTVIGDPSTPVTSENLRGLPVGRLLQRACEVVPHVVQDTEGADPFAPDYYSDAERDAARALGPTPVTLGMVAMVYRAAELAESKPAWWVSDRFGIPQRTATHWVKLARERGHLSAVTDG